MLMKPADSPASEPLPELPLDIEHVFERLFVRYGHRFLAQWEGAKTATIKDDWAQELQGVTYAGMQWGLSHLPSDHPPTVGEFRKICGQRPVYVPHQKSLGLDRAPPPPEVQELLDKAAADPTLPPRVRWAKHFLSIWDKPEAKPGFIQRTRLTEAREIVKHWDEQLAERARLAKAKKAAQAATDERLKTGGDDGGHRD